MESANTNANTNILSSRTVQECFRRAERLQDEGKFPEAAEAWLDLLGKFKATSAGEAASQYVSLERSAAIHLAEASNRLQRFDQALEWAAFGLARQPTELGRAVALAARGEALGGLGRAAESKTAFAESIQAHPIEGRLHGAAAMVRVGTEELLKEAHQRLEEVLRSFAGSLEPRQRARLEAIRGCLAARRGNVEQARNHLSWALIAFPDCQEARREYDRLPVLPRGSTHRQAQSRPTAVATVAVLAILCMISVVYFQYAKARRQPPPEPPSPSIEALTGIADTPRAADSNEVRAESASGPTREAGDADPPVAIPAADQVATMVAAGSTAATNAAGASPEEAKEAPSGAGPAGHTDDALAAMEVVDDAAPILPEFWDDRERFGLKNTADEFFPSPPKAPSLFPELGGVAVPLDPRMMEERKLPLNLRTSADKQKRYALSVQNQAQINAQRSALEARRVALDQKTEMIQRLHRELENLQQRTSASERAAYLNKVEQFNRELKMLKDLYAEYKRLAEAYNAKLRTVGQPDLHSGP